jgi:N-acetylglucosamine kinase-like BadF-type ATPase
MCATQTIAYAGMDGGGTKTQCVICDADEKPIGIGEAGPTNANFVTLEEAKTNARKALDDAFEQAAIARCVAAGLAVAGTLFGEPDSEQGAGVLAERCGVVHSYAEHQASLASCGLFDDFGVSVVAGTGSSVVAFRDGKTHFAGGWGATLGDEGSAYDIAMHAVKGALKSYDGSGPKSDVLEAIVLDHFGVARMYAMPGLFYHTGLRRDVIADLCRRLASEKTDDPVIRQCFINAGHELAGLAASAGAKLFKPEDRFPVAEGGSVWQAGGDLVEVFESSFRTAFPLADFRPRVMTPAHGLAVRVKRDTEGT